MRLGMPLTVPVDPDRSETMVGRVQAEPDPKPDLAAQALRVVSESDGLMREQQNQCAVIVFVAGSGPTTKTNKFKRREKKYIMKNNKKMKILLHANEKSRHHPMIHVVLNK